MRKKGHLGVNLEAPVPLGYRQAVDRAYVLRETHRLPWPALMFVMAEYHGFDRSTGWWRRELRHRVTARPRGSCIQNLNRPAADIPDTPGLRGYLAGVYDGPGGSNQ